MRSEVKYLGRIAEEQVYSYFTIEVLIVRVTRMVVQRTREPVQG